MDLQDVLDAVCETLRTETGRSVAVERPDVSASEIVVWPWSMEEVSTLGQFAPGGGEVAPAAARLRVRCFIFSNLDISGLSEVRRVLRENPVLEAGGIIRITPNPLSVEELCSVFRAAGVPLRLCGSYALDAEESAS